MPALYTTDEGQSVVTNSMLSTFVRCPKQAEYKYALRLKPRLTGKPLSRGSWIHELLEVHGNGGDWKEHHRKLSARFSNLFEEEREYYGDMPREIATVMVSYFWHYQHDPWKVLESEITLEAELPDGTLFRCKIDWLIENQFGLWLVDHKSHKTLPGLLYRMLDTQGPRYVWTAHMNNIPVKGFIWNYIRWKAPTVPQVLKNGSRLSKSKIDTDFPTAYRAIKRYGLDVEPYKPWLRSLRAAQYRPGEPQTSPFFRRDVFEKAPDLLRRMELQTIRSAERMNTYDFTDPDSVERVVTRSCEYMCSYKDLCALELMTGRDGVRNLMRQNFTQGDPLDYYQDRAGDAPEGG